MTLEDIETELLIFTASKTAFKITAVTEEGETTIWVAAEEGKLGEKMPEAPQKAGYEFKGWNTKPKRKRSMDHRGDADHGGSDDVCDL